MEIILNTPNYCVWVRSQSALGLHCKHTRDFAGLNRVLKGYPEDTRPMKGDEPQFRLPRYTPAKSLVDELVGVLGAKIVKTIWPTAQS